MLAQAQRCSVCGWRGEQDVCPRCGTVLRATAPCPRCGKELQGPVARCDACGASVRGTPRPPRQALARLTRLPGIGEATARWLYDHGYEEPADVLELALPERAVRLGLHHTLARKMTMEGLRPVPRSRKSVPCPVCGMAKTAATGACPACGAYGIREPSPEQIQRQLAEVVGEVYDLAADPDFQGLPTELREEILEAFESPGPLEVPVPAYPPLYATQFREWRTRGLDTSLVERIFVEEGEDAFKAQFATIIRRQVAKRRANGRFLCPICEDALNPDEPECENCGAKFG